MAERRTRTWRRRLLVPVLFGLAVGAGVVATPVVARLFAPHSWAGTRFAVAGPAPAMDGLVLDDGSPVHLDAFRGEVVLVYFGYLSCPDVCPTTLATAADAIDSVGAADDVTLLMVSVDPARDSLDEIGDYVRHFHPSFAGVGGPEPAVADAATLYGIFYELGDPDDNGDYDVAHTAGLLGIDRDGNLAVRWGPDVGTDALAADLREMLR